ncbi:TPA: transcription factor [Klebsiella variicola]|uniref:HTH-like domain-containing protein n=1 Tax=Klebsiella pneumoniae TaxID=573 RepID=UPI000E2C0897|nr:transcription factor [Klebsiella pneumoniae]HCT8863627.1 transcription factor [Klebsiella variicola]MDG3467983.1 transcription factor [Klebsiella pneumoniae]MDS1046974.1 transcription factor [Klebsiella pneumoniae]MDS1065522.1 transcription factor [Klebsiella pneumoniae]MDS1117636.1 transcription factor [Klebsiella pneumoniae]
MKQSEIFSAIRKAVDSAPKGDRTVTVQLQIIKYYQNLTGVTAREFVEEVGLKSSLVTLYTDSIKLACKLSEAGMDKDKI